MNLPDIPEYVAGYFNFIIDFAIDPEQACSPYKASNKVDKNLLTYAAIGTTLTLFTIILLKQMGDHYNDKSHLFDFINKLDKDVIPFAILPGVIIFSLIVHLLVRLIFRFNKEDKGITPAHINCKNTINGALAYFSFAPFIIMFFFLLTMAAAYNFPKASMWLVLLLLSPIIIFTSWAIFWQFPASITAMQPDELKKSYKKAIWSSVGLIITIFALTDWLRSLFN